MIADIPDVIHICPRCQRLASGECEHCLKVYLAAARQAILDEFHRRRAAKLYGSLPRVGGGERKPFRQRMRQRWETLRGALFVGALFGMLIAMCWGWVELLQWAARIALRSVHP